MYSVRGISMPLPPRISSSAISFFLQNVFSFRDSLDAYPFGPFLSFQIAGSMEEKEVFSETLTNQLQSSWPMDKDLQMCSISLSMISIMCKRLLSPELKWIQVLNVEVIDGETLTQYFKDPIHMQ